MVEINRTRAENEKFLETPTGKIAVRTNTVQEDGTPGQLITGVDYVAGKSGVDASTETLQTIDYSHHEVHSGSAFLVWDRKDLSNAAVQDYSIVTPNTTKWPHLILEITSEAEACVQLYEVPTLSADGTPFTAYNKNRNSAKVATTIVNDTPAVTATGTTIIFEDQWGSGKQVGGGSRGVEEFILKQNTKYLIRITNLTTSSNFISVHFNWYEHTNKN